MFDHCPTWLGIQLEATVSNTSTLVRLREFAAEKRESSRKQSKINSYSSRCGGGGGGGGGSSSSSSSSSRAVNYNKSIH